MIIPFLIAAVPIGIQIILAIHVVKTGRDRSWIYLIVFLPLVGSAIYFFIEVLPELMNRNNMNTIKSTVTNIINPGGTISKLQQQYDFSKTHDNKMALINAYLTQGFNEQAILLLKESLEGIYANDEEILSKLGAACFHSKQFEDAKKYYQQLKDTKGCFANSEEHFNFAETLENLNDIEAAAAEYEYIARKYSGLESHCRYGLFLKEQGKTEDAFKQFQTVLALSNQLPSYNIRANKEWINRAKLELGNYSS